jgi:hypothetical protein
VAFYAGTVDFADWLTGEWDEAVGRLRGQVFALVPEDRRVERPGGGNSVLWGTFHVARHAALALAVVGADGPVTAGLFSGHGLCGVPDGGGLEEAEPAWAGELTATGVDAYFAVVGDATRRFLAAVSLEQLDRLPDAEGALERAGISPEGFGWLYRMWSAQPVAFFVRWPLVGHLVNHVGEMIATRNRMGLSPF